MRSGFLARHTVRVGVVPGVPHPRRRCEGPLASPPAQTTTPCSRPFAKGAPARATNRLASWHRTPIGDKHILCVELHLIPGLHRQRRRRRHPGYRGPVPSDHHRKATSSDYHYHPRRPLPPRRPVPPRTVQRPDWTSTGIIPSAQLPTATDLLDVTTARLRKPNFGPPITRYPFGALRLVSRTPRLLCDSVDFRAFHPILIGSRHHPKRGRAWPRPQRRRQTRRAARGSARVSAPTMVIASG